MDSWLSRRSESIGGSDVPVILSGRIPLDFDPGFGSEVDVWSSKKIIRQHHNLGEKPQKTGEALERGTLAEPLCRDYVSSHYDAKFSECFLDMYRRDDFPNFHGSIDGEGVLDGKVYGLEIKTMGYRGDSWTKSVPTRVELQSRHNWFCRPSLDGFIVAGFKAPEEVWRLVNSDKVSVAECIENRSMKFWSYKLEKSDWYEETCVPILQDWWNTHIEGKEAPRADHKKETKDCIYEIWNRYEGESDIDEPFESLLQERMHAQSEKKRWSSEFERLQNEVRLRMKGSKAARGDRFSVSMSRIDKSTFSSTLFKEEHPELYAKYFVESSYSTMKVTERTKK